MNTNIHPRRTLIRNLVLLVLGLTACTWIAYFGLPPLIAASFGDWSGSRCASSNPQEIEKVAGIKPPPSTANLQSHCDGLNTWWAEAYFDMKPSDLAAFVNSTNVKLPLSTTGKPEKLECVPCNHVPNLRSYLYGTYYRDEYEWFEEIFIDTSNPSLYRVYFTLLAG